LNGGLGVCVEKVGHGVGADAELTQLPRCR